MVHVLSGVLQKIWGSLRNQGKVLIFEPARENPIIEVHINGNIAYRVETNEPNFRSYLHANVEAIHRSVDEGIFEIQSEKIVPERNSYLSNEYASLSEWQADRLSFCEDIETFTELSERIRKVIGSRGHRVIEFWREYQVILRKK